MIRYCNRCVTPETRPHLHIDEEFVCSACRNFEKRSAIDWQGRRRELLELLERYRREDGSNYDCIVPVSGGKDSHFQVIKMLEFGFNPLCVNAHPADTPDIGRRNIENLKRVGADFVEVSVNPNIWSRLARIGLTQVGDISWPEHIAIFTIPVRLAVQMNIPLLIWGENPEFEYGGPAAAAANHLLTRAWLEEFGSLQGLRVSDMIGQDGIENRHLIQLTYPSEEELARVGATGIFLGFYLPWDNHHNALIAQAYGFETKPAIVEQQMVTYENLDNHHNGIHEYFMYLKYGFARATSQASILIRHGYLSREEAVAIIRDKDGAFPWSYLDKSLDQILAPLEMTMDEFVRTCDRFANKKLFQTNNRGELIKDAEGRPLKINEIV